MNRARIRGLGAILLVVAGFSGLADAQVAPTTGNPASKAPIERSDPALDTASSLIGRALFLRCFCAENNLNFDAEGQVSENPKTTDWTLAGINVQKVSRKGPNELELDGVRVAIRFATDRREFDRHPLNDDKMKVQLVDPHDTAALAREIKAIFSEGLDRRLQLAMPSYWQHYFDPQLAWPADDLSSQTIYTAGNVRIPGTTPAGEGFIPVTATKKASAPYTSQASHDRVSGSVDLRVVVDTKGEVHHISIAQPLGYGLDARAAEALAKWKFVPAKLQGKPVAAYALIRPDFEVVDLPH